MCACIAACWAASSPALLLLLLALLLLPVLKKPGVPKPLDDDVATDGEGSDDWGDCTGFDEKLNTDGDEAPIILLTPLLNGVAGCCRLVFVMLVFVLLLAVPTLDPNRDGVAADPSLPSTVVGPHVTIVGNQWKPLEHKLQKLET